jgi:succinoglycan biosynthesis protein ExoA
MRAPAEGRIASPPPRGDEEVDVSVLVPVRNEAAVIRDSVAAMCAQRFPGRLELLLVDGRSEDGTRAVLEALAREDPRIRVLDNPRRRIAAALNIGLAHARGRFVARMDAHTLYPPDYLATAVARMQRGDVACVSGPQIPHGTDAGSRRVALALASPLGIGGAAFRRELAEEVETDGAFTGVWRRSTLVRLGGWDPEWLVNEDGELAARVRAAGGRYVCVPAMAARYVPRRTLGALARQYRRYGRYRAKTCGRHPESMRPSHLLPPALVLALAGSLVPRPIARPARAAAGAYAVALAMEGARAAARGGRAREAPLVAAVLATMHLSWGSGFIAGAVRFGVPVRGVVLAGGRAVRAGTSRPRRRRVARR